MDSNKSPLDVSKIITLYDLRAACSVHGRNVLAKNLNMNRNLIGRLVGWNNLDGNATISSFVSVGKQELRKMAGFEKKSDVQQKQEEFYDNEEFSEDEFDDWDYGFRHPKSESQLIAEEKNHNLIASLQICRSSFADIGTNKAKT